MEQRDTSHQSEKPGPLRALEQAIDNAGGQVAMATALGLKQSAISNWVTRKKRVPAERVLSVERLSGVSRHDLRPDLYPRDEPLERLVRSA